MLPTPGGLGKNSTGSFYRLGRSGAQTRAVGSDRRVEATVEERSQEVGEMRGLKLRSDELGSQRLQGRGGAQGADDRQGRQSRGLV